MNYQELEVQTTVSCHRVLRIEPGSYGSAVSTLNLLIHLYRPNHLFS